MTLLSSGPEQGVETENQRSKPGEKLSAGSELNWLLKMRIDRDLAVLQSAEQQDGSFVMWDLLRDLAEFTSEFLNFPLTV